MNGPEKIAALGGTQVTLDEVLRRDPKNVDRDRDLKPLIETLRADRARFHAAEQKRREKKQGVEDVDVEVPADEPAAAS